MKRRTSLLKWLLILVFVVIAVGIVFQRQWIYDFARGLTYQPSSEMKKIREKLDLTDKGLFLFNASHPVLNLEEDFNNNCRSFDEESAILGCYTEQNIFVYDITEERLAGIRELTVAHELLHAVYERMSISERDGLKTDLEKVYRDNQDVLKKEIEAYDTAEQLEEIYVRSGTEIKNLPDSLEKHFAEVFKDQDLIVDFYNSYIKVFREIENELNTLKTEMEEIDKSIETKTNEYERRFEKLDADIAQFNNCAETVGCFESEYAFRVRRNQLLAEQSAINALYDEIDGLIDEYNLRVEKYNNNVIESENLQNIINSHVKKEGI